MHYVLYDFIMTASVQSKETNLKKTLDADVCVLFLMIQQGTFCVNILRDTIGDMITCTSQLIIFLLDKSSEAKLNSIHTKVNRVLHIANSPLVLHIANFPLASCMASLIYLLRGGKRGGITVFRCSLLRSHWNSNHNNQLSVCTMSFMILLWWERLDELSLYFLQFFFSFYKDLLFTLLVMEMKLC